MTLLSVVDCTSNCAFVVGNAFTTQSKLESPVLLGASGETSLGNVAPPLPENLITTFEPAPADVHRMLSGEPARVLDPPPGSGFVISAPTNMKVLSEKSAPFPIIVWMRTLPVSESSSGMRFGVGQS